MSLRWRSLPFHRFPNTDERPWTRRTENEWLVDLFHDRLWKFNWFSLSNWGGPIFFTGVCVNTQLLRLVHVGKMNFLKLNLLAQLVEDVLGSGSVCFFPSQRGERKFCDRLLCSLPAFLFNDFEQIAEKCHPFFEVGDTLWHPTSAVHELTDFSRFYWKAAVDDPINVLEVLLDSFPCDNPPTPTEFCEEER